MTLALPQLSAEELEEVAGQADLPLSFPFSKRERVELGIGQMKTERDRAALPGGDVGVAAPGDGVTKRIDFHLVGQSRARQRLLGRVEQLDTDMPAARPATMIGVRRSVPAGCR